MRLASLAMEKPMATLAWGAAWASVLCAGAALLPSGLLGWSALLVGLAVGLAAAPIYLRRATSASAVAVTIAAALVSSAVLQSMAGHTIAEGFSVSQAGGRDEASAWLLTTTVWFFGAGLTAAARLVVRDGVLAGRLTTSAHRVASPLTFLPVLGFLVVGAVRVGRYDTLFVVHNLAAVAAMIPFWIGLVWTSRNGAVSRRLRLFSGVSAAVIFVTWLPTALRFLKITDYSPIETLPMEMLAFALSFAWLAWLGREWAAAARRGESMATARP